MSYIAYEGPSMLDNQPIACIVTGIDRPSLNPKTGPMLQTFIIRADISPVEAVKTGQDSSICGDCKLRGVNGKQRGCYVTVFQAPRQVYDHYHRTNKTKFKPGHARGYGVRLGSYGDPVALPLPVIRDMVKYANTWTGYTHQWKTCDPDFKEYLMASVDSIEEYEEAQSRGWRTFRIAKEIYARQNEIICPATRTNTNCLSCGLCNGGKRSTSIIIEPHGIGAKYIQ